MIAAIFSSSVRISLVIDIFLSHSCFMIAGSKTFLCIFVQWPSGALLSDPQSRRLFAFRSTGDSADQVSTEKIYLFLTALCKIIEALFFCLPVPFVSVYKLNDQGKINVNFNQSVVA